MLYAQSEAEQRHLSALTEQKQANIDLQRLLRTLPDRTKLPVMVPFGSVAFFPGHLVHTNECFVDMGKTAVLRTGRLCILPVTAGYKTCPTANLHFCQVKASQWRSQQKRHWMYWGRDKSCWVCFC